MLDDGYCLFGTETLLRRLQKLTKEIGGVREGKDIEYVHRMRVASRRIRSALMLFGDCFSDKDVRRWNKEMRRVRRALGAARDLDVQMDFLRTFLGKLTKRSYRPGIKRLLLRLQQRREKLQAKVVKSMDRLEASGVLNQMGKALRSNRVRARMKHTDEHSPYVYQQAYLNISLRLEDMLAFEPYVNLPDHQEELHAMRIAAKNLRYTMEIFEPLYDGKLKPYIQVMRRIQTLLGDFHDCHVWIEFLPKFLAQEEKRTQKYYGHLRTFGRLRSGILYLEQDRKSHMMKVYQEFASYWQELHDADTWRGLLELVSPPLPEAELPELLS